MLNFHRVPELLFPSPPRRLRREAEAASQTVGTTNPCAGADAQPESGVGRPSSSAPLSGPPIVENLLNWRAHPGHRFEFSDSYLAELLDRWKGAPA